MKNFARCLVMLFLIGVSSNSYSQEWVSYNPYVQPQPQIQTIYVQPQPVIVYQWVPVLVNKNIFVEQYYLCRKIQRVIVQPTIYWIYQPVLVYR